MTPLSVGIVGASGYTGGELLRLLVDHPSALITQITSNRSVGKYAHQVHPHLRGSTDLRFVSADELQPCDILFLALPHGEAQTQVDRLAALAPRIIDLSADFRLRDPNLYAETYEHQHQKPDWLSRFVYGLPELHRDEIREASYVSGVGCNATVVTLAVWPLVRTGLIDPSQPLIADLKVGSSEAGNTPSESSHHPARVGVVRPFKLTGHRHEAEVRQNLAPCGSFDVRMSISSVEMVRGIAAAVHLTLPCNLKPRDLWHAYRSVWNEEPFVRIVHEGGGLHAHPEPRLLAGTNFVDVGWDYDPASGRTVLLAALDNLGKGAAGSAIQCMNLMCDFDERTSLTFRGMYP